jgi:hypothetical protein
MSQIKPASGPEWDSAIEKLTELTEKGQLNWALIDDFSGRRSDEKPVLPAFRAEVQGRHVLVYEYEFKNYTDADEWEWDTGIAVEFVDGRNGLEYTWQGNEWPRRRLLETIRYRAANVGEFLEEFLKS